MRVQDQPVYILHQRPFRDTSQILEIFSRDYGRLSLVSRGSRSPKSRLKAILQPFQALQANWSGRGEMPSLGRVEAVSIKRPLLKSAALPCAFYMNELIMRLLHKHDVHDDVFELYQNTLHVLASTEDLELELRLSMPIPASGCWKIGITIILSNMVRCKSEAILTATDWRCV